MFLTKKNENYPIQKYLEYIFYEKRFIANIGIGFVVTLYEKAVEKYSHDPYIWLSYLGFITSYSSDLCERNNKAPNLLLNFDNIRNIASRSVRTSYECMTNADLWSYNMRIQFMKDPSNLEGFH
jgi:hypothetical protein